MDSNGTLAEVMNYFRSESWIARVFAVVFTALLIDWLQKRMMGKLAG